MNPSQKMPTFNRGQALPADALNHVVQALKRMITEGKGIRIESAGDKIVIHAKGGPIPTGGGGGGIMVYEGVNVAAFPDPSTVEQTSFARVTGSAGDPLGSMYVVSPDREAWVCFTHFG